MVLDRLEKRFWNEICWGLVDVAKFRIMIEKRAWNFDFGSIKQGMKLQCIGWCLSAMVVVCENVHFFAIIAEGLDSRLPLLKLG